MDTLEEFPESCTSPAKWRLRAEEEHPTHPSALADAGPGSS